MAGRIQTVDELILKFILLKWPVFLPDSMLAVDSTVCNTHLQHMHSRRQKKVPIYRPYYETGNPVPFPSNFRPIAVQSPFVFNPFYGQPVRSINQVNSLGRARN